MASFTIFGIRIRVDQSWFIALFLYAWTLSSGYFPFQAPNYSTLTYWVFGTVSAFGLFACVLIHELSHSVVARKLGMQVRQITLFIFGGVSEMTHSEANTPGAEFRVTIAGPLSSLAMGLVFGITFLMFRTMIGAIGAQTLLYLTYVNVVLAAFNLIPGFPLDGGRVLRSYLWHRTGNIGQATRTAARVGAGFATVLMAIAFLNLVYMHFVVGIWLLLIGIFLRKSAEQEYRSVQLRTSLEHVLVSDIMSPPVAVKKGVTISELVSDYVFHYHERQFPVVDRGKFIGMIDIHALKKIPVADWPSTYIDAFVADPSSYCVLDPDMDATEALRRMVDQPSPKAPVLRNDVLVGSLARADIADLIALKSELAA